MTEPLPCPFCGSTDVWVSEDDDGFARWVSCNDCECDGPLMQYSPTLELTRDQVREIVVAKWNERNTSAHDRIRELEAQLNWAHTIIYYNDRKL